MKATESLDRDHRVIETVMPAIERMAQMAQEGVLAELEHPGRVIDFLREFVDAYHHGKEEQHLFPAMEKRGVPRDRGLIMDLLREHGQGRRLVRAMSKSLRAAESDVDAARDLSDRAREYLHLIRAHIAKEDSQLWPLAESVLTPEDDARLADSYAQVEAATLGAHGLARYRETAAELVTLG